MKIENLKIWLWVAVPAIMAAYAGYYFQLTRAEWPSWVQAVGSVLAIFAAVLIMSEQHRQQEQRASTTARDERANLILAAIVHGQEVFELHRVIGKTLGHAELIPAPLLPFALSRLGTALDDLKGVPITRMGLDDGILVAVVKSSASNLMSALKILEYNEAKKVPNPHSVTIKLVAVGMKNSTTIGMQDLTRVLADLHARYLSLTGFPAPALPNQP